MRNNLNQEVVDVISCLMFGYLTLAGFDLGAFMT